MKGIHPLLGLLLLIHSGLAEEHQAHFKISLEERVAYQKAIEEVYWKHTIWPADNPQPKPALDAVVSVSDIRFKTEEYLRKSFALTSYWHMPIAGQEMQNEIDRMARETKDPQVLHELWASLSFLSKNKENAPF